MNPPRIDGIGAAAGGIVALRRLVSALRPNLGAALLVVVHAPPDKPNLLPQLLGATGPLPACEASDGQPIELGRIYVAPPDKHMRVQSHRLRLERDISGYRSWPAVDPLFLSIADEPDCARRAIGIVLSGGDADGAQGLAAIKAAGGTVIVQTPSDASCPIMPNKAIALNSPDYCLPADAIGALLNRLVNSPAKQPAPGSSANWLPPDESEPKASADKLCVLVAEDVYPIAVEVSYMLRSLGHEPFGPVASVAAGIELLNRQASKPDAAVLDIDLRGEAVYGLATALRAHGVPFVFATGYALHAIPSEWREVPRIEKPFTVEDLGEALMRARAQAPRADAAHRADPEHPSPVGSDAAGEATLAVPPGEPSQPMRRSWERTKNVRNARMVFGMGLPKRQAKHKS